MIHTRKFKRTNVIKSQLIRAKGKGETLEQMYARLDKPTYLINGGYFTMADGWTLAALKVDGEVIREVSSVSYGYVLAGKGSSIKIHSMGDKSFLDITEKYDWAIEVPLALPIIRGVPDADSKEPRTAFGYINATDEYEIAVTDGRPYGVTIDQLGDHMQSSSAVNLDGGGSSKVLYKGKAINKQGNRPIANAIAIWVSEEKEPIKPSNPFALLPKYKDIRNTIRKHPTLKFPDNGIDAKTDIAIHHSLTKTGSAESYANYHIDTHGWPGIGYSFVIEKDGTIKHCNDINVRTYHVGNSNDFAVGVCLTGDFRTQEPTNEQKDSLRSLHKVLKQVMPNYKRTRGHNEFPGYEWKQCPMFDYNAVLSEPKPTLDNTFYRVQIGYFGVKENAERLAKELESQGYQTIIKEETK